MSTCITRRVAHQEVVRPLFESSDDPVLTTDEIASELDICNCDAFLMLVDLAKHGPINYKLVEGAVEVWWFNY